MVFTKEEIDLLLKAIAEVQNEAQKLSPMPVLKRSESPVIQGRRPLNSTSPLAEPMNFNLFNSSPLTPNKKKTLTPTHSPYSKIGPGY